MSLPMDVADLRDFYQSPLGRSAGGLIINAMQPLMKVTTGQTVLGIGYATPYLKSLVPKDATSIAFMLARQGVTAWPRSGAVQSALVDEYDLPLLESVADHVIVAHGLEFAETPVDMLQEIWRVLAPQGRLTVVVPNRRGLWSASERSPFGYGTPFSRSQLSKLLKEAQFQVLNWRHALFAPPLSGRSALSVARYLERPGSMAIPRYSGVVIVEATKQVYAFSSGKRSRRLMPRFRPILLPAPHANKFKT
jgi:SAM-dependent methyltransferase